MAAHTVARAKSAALTANTEDTIELTANKRWIQILNRSGTVSAATTLYVKVGPKSGQPGTPAPTAVAVAADNALACVAGNPLLVQFPPPGADGTLVALVRVIATNAVDYTVQALDLP